MMYFLGQRSVENLSLAALKVLHEVTNQGCTIGPASLSKKLGVFREGGHATKNGNDFIIYGALSYLDSFNILEKEQSRGGGYRLNKQCQSIFHELISQHENVKTNDHLTNLGMAQLRAAILEALYGVYDNKGLSPAQISKEAQIFRKQGIVCKNFNDAFVWGGLNLLCKEKMVVKSKESGSKYTIAHEEWNKYCFRQQQLRGINSFGGRNKGLELLLMQQYGLCAGSGDFIYPDNVDTDHMHPKSKGG